jgi:hypothetical protein
MDVITNLKDCKNEIKEEYAVRIIQLKELYYE